MVRRSRQSYDTAEEIEHDGVEIEGLFQFVKRDGGSFCVHTGNERVNEIGIRIQVDHWIPLSLVIENSWGDLHDMMALSRGDYVKFRIPEWLATKEGLV